MTTDYSALGDCEKMAIVNVCACAGFADGSLTDLEREALQKVAQSYSGADLSATLQQTLGGPVKLDEVVRDLKSANAKALAYEMAVCICSADQSVNPAEKQFLESLRTALGLEGVGAQEFQKRVSDFREEPPIIPVGAPVPAGLEELIRDRAVLAGALELLPQRLSTMAIVPVQMRLVYQIGKSFGYELDLTHAREFLATVGVGLTSQVVEGYLSKLVGHLAKPFLGRFVAGLASQATESVVAFATTYALGQAAKSYYQSGRTLSSAQLRDVFSSMIGEGRALQGRYGNQIAQRASTLNVANLLSGLKS